jgi:DnaJ-class molecular chaperone
MDYYKTLHIEENASSDEIKKAYRKLSLKHHPDKGGDSKIFKEINEAYQILGDKQKKQEYDFKRNMKHNGIPHINTRGIPPEIIKMMFSNGNMSMNGMPFFHFSQSMNNEEGPNIRIFKNGVQQPTPMQRPVPIIKTIHISFEQAYNGVNLPLEIERWINENNVKTFEKETLYVDIPKGIDNNEIIILRNKGNIISDDNKGDIKLFIKINNDTIFERKGIDLLLKKKISLKEALCGFSFDIKYFNERKFTIKNEKNIIKSGYSKVVPNLGMTRGNYKGNLIIIFDVEFPDSLNENQIQLLREIL